nr:hypothetical protein Iba_chr01fCG0800 [Ipomoea batatas]
MSFAGTPEISSSFLTARHVDSEWPRHLLKMNQRDAARTARNGKTDIRAVESRKASQALRTTLSSAPIPSLLHQLTKMPSAAGSTFAGTGADLALHFNPVAGKTKHKPTTRKKKKPRRRDQPPPPPAAAATSTNHSDRQSEPRRSRKHDVRNAESDGQQTAASPLQSSQLLTTVVAVSFIVNMTQKSRCAGARSEEARNQTKFKKASGLLRGFADKKLCSEICGYRGDEDEEWMEIVRILERYLWDTVWRE